MPYQLIIHHDDGRQEIAAAGTQQEVYAAMPTIKIDPEQALWEMKWVTPAAHINGIQSRSQMGMVKRTDGQV